ncbi:MAG: hypothetical protein MSS66_10840 [Selenomonadaceae bacterium]|nr:hypothetical protein [Selenomonadaceae bacterium]
MAKEKTCGLQARILFFAICFPKRNTSYRCIKHCIRSEASSEGVNHGISQGKLSMLIELVRDGYLSLPAAAKKANLDEAMFKAKMATAL